jgi:membrane protein
MTIMTIKAIGSLFLDAGKEWVTDHAPRMSAALAFYAILSLTPLLVITTAVMGFVLGEDAARGQIVQQLQGLIGPAGAEVVQTLLQNANQPRAGLVASLLGIVMLLFGASGVFVELQDDLNVVWKAESKERTGWWDTIKERLFSFAIVLAVGFLLLVSLVVSAILATVGSVIQDFLPTVGALVFVLNVAISLSVTTLLFALMFRYLPDYKLPWRVVLIGAALTAILFTVGKFLIGLYVKQAGLASPFGAAGAVVILVVWVHYSALIFFYGAEITQMIEKKGTRMSRPSGLPASDEDRYRYQGKAPPKAV